MRALGKVRRADFVRPSVPMSNSCDGFMVRLAGNGGNTQPFPVGTGKDFRRDSLSSAEIPRQDVGQVRKCAVVDA